PRPARRDDPGAAGPLPPRRDGRAINDAGRPGAGPLDRPARGRRLVAVAAAGRVRSSAEIRMKRYDETSITHSRAERMAAIRAGVAVTLHPRARVNLGWPLGDLEVVLDRIEAEATGSYIWPP